MEELESQVNKYAYFKLSLSEQLIKLSLSTVDPNARIRTQSLVLINSTALPAYEEESDVWILRAERQKNCAALAFGTLNDNTSFCAFREFMRA